MRYFGVRNHDLFWYTCHQVAALYGKVARRIGKLRQCGAHFYFYLFSGTVAYHDVVLTADVLKAALVMPVPAIQRGAQGSFVYKVNADSTVSVQAVTLGPQDGQRVVVQRGLKAGDRVVTDGADRLKDGAQVEVPAAHTVAAPAAATHPKWQHKPGETGHHHAPSGGA